jgi:hypothetical protein
MISVPTVYRRIISHPNMDLLETMFGQARKVVTVNA